MNKYISVLYSTFMLILSGIFMSVSLDYSLKPNDILIFMVINLFLIYVYHSNFNIFNLFLPTNVLIYFYIFFIMVGVVISPLYVDIIIISGKLIFFITQCLAVFIIGCIVTKASNSSIMRNEDIMYALKNSEPIVTNYKIFIFIGFFLYLVYFLKIGAIPFLSSNADDFRVEALKGNGKIVLLGYGFLINSLIQKLIVDFKDNSNYNAVIVSFFCGFIVLGVGFRGNAFKIILISIVFYIVTKYKKIPKVKMIIILCMLFALVAVTGFFRNNGQFVLTKNVILKVTFWRFFVNIYNLEQVYNYVLNYGYLFGKTYILDLNTLLPGYQMSSSMYMKQILGLEFSGGGITPTIFGEALINFGYLFALLFILLLSIVIGLYQRKICSKILENKWKYVHLIFVVAYSIDPVIGSGIMPMLLFSLMPILVTKYVMDITTSLLSNISRR